MQIPIWGNWNLHLLEITFSDAGWEITILGVVVKESAILCRMGALLHVGQVQSRWFGDFLWFSLLSKKSVEA